MRWLVDSPANLQKVRVALDQANGLRDAQGNLTPRRCRIFRNGVDVTGTIYDPAFYGFPVLTTTTVDEAIIGDDGSAALALPEVPEVDAYLGKTIGGLAIAAAKDLVAEDALPARVKAAILAKEAVANLDQAVGLGKRAR